MIALLLLCALHVVSAKSIAGDQLVDFSSTAEELRGTYRRAASESVQDLLGIEFVSRQDHLTVKTLDGKLLVSTDTMRPVKGRMARSVHVLEQEYLQHESADHRSFDKPLNNAKPFSETAKILLDFEEVALLEAAARAISEKGITGINAPAAIPFFVFALRVSQAAAGGIGLQNSASAASPVNAFGRQKRQLPLACLSDCPPCRSHHCLGMCGRRCDCWSFICGDCCYHHGCYEHDLCCADDWYSYACWIPWGFSCSGYNC